MIILQKVILYITAALYMVVIQHGEVFFNIKSVTAFLRGHGKFPIIGWYKEFLTQHAMPVIDLR